MKVFLVEDNIDLADMLKAYLESEQYAVTSFSSGKEAMANLDGSYDIYVFDIMIDEINGYDLLNKLKSINSDAKVIFISARDSDVDKVLGLESGVDDYITKPFSPKELVIRIRNIQKRYSFDEKFINYECYKIDVEKRLVYESDKLLKLTTKEYDLLYLLVTNKFRAFSREDIIEALWHDYYGTDRTVDDLVRRLRKKLPALNLETIYGFGYRLS